MPEDPPDKTDPTLSILRKATEDPSLPRIYANGFSAGLGNADVVLVLQLQGKPIAVLNISYTLAKTLAQKIGGIVASFEQSIGQELVTTDKVDQKMKEKKSSEPGTTH